MYLLRMQLIFNIAILAVLLFIFKSIRMSEQTLQDLRNIISGIREQNNSLSTSIAGIRGDIQRILEGLPADGGLTAEEVTTLRDELGVLLSESAAVAQDAASLDAENQEPAP